MPRRINDSLDSETGYHPKSNIHRGTDLIIGLDPGVRDPPVYDPLARRRSPRPRCQVRMPKDTQNTYGETQDLFRSKRADLSMSSCSNLNTTTRYAIRRHSLNPCIRDGVEVRRVRRDATGEFPGKQVVAPGGALDRS